MKRLMAILSVFVLLLLVTHRKDEPEEVPPTTSIIFPHPVQILMPGDLCDNYQGTLMYWFEEFRKAAYEFRPALQEKLEEVRTAMKGAGCG